MTTEPEPRTAGEAAEAAKARTHKDLTGLFSNPFMQPSFRAANLANPAAGRILGTAAAASTAATRVRKADPVAAAPAVGPVPKGKRVSPNGNPLPGAPKSKGKGKKAAPAPVAVFDGNGQLLGYVGDPDDIIPLDGTVAKSGVVVRGRFGGLHRMQAQHNRGGLVGFGSREAVSKALVSVRSPRLVPQRRR